MHCTTFVDSESQVILESQLDESEECREVGPQRASRVHSSCVQSRFHSSCALIPQGDVDFWLEFRHESDPLDGSIKVISKDQGSVGDTIELRNGGLSYKDEAVLSEPDLPQPLWQRVVLVGVDETREGRADVVLSSARVCVHLPNWNHAFVDHVDELRNVVHDISSVLRSSVFPGPCQRS